MPSKSLAKKGEKCQGGKKAMERLTVLLCCNCAGEKLKPLVIGKSKYPQAFRKVKIQAKDLPVRWCYNKKAWMTMKIFHEWLEDLNIDLKRNNRKILLFLDNVTSHASLDLSNVHLIHFPPNTTSDLQPLDQGIIQNMKLLYRKKLLQNCLNKINDFESVSDYTHSITVLDAIWWIDLAWNSIKVNTFENCFKNAGFFRDEFRIAQSDFENEDLLNDIDTLLVNSCFESKSLTAKDFYNFDDCLTLHEEINGETHDEILESVILDNESESDSDSISENFNMDVDKPTLTTTEVMSLLENVLEWAISSKSKHISEVSSLLSSITDDFYREQKFQTDIRSYFK